MGSGEGFTMRNFITSYRSPNIIRVIKSRRLRWAGHVARMEEGRGALKMLRGERAQGRPRRIWQGNIRMDLK